MHCGHLSKSYFAIKIENKKEETIFEGTLEELIEKLEVNDDNQELSTSIEEEFIRERV